MRALLILLTLATSTFAAGPIIFGARGGVPLTESLNNRFTNGIGVPSTGARYVIGPTLGIRLPLGFSVEGDALFSRQKLTFAQVAGFSADANSDSWEFPVMLRFAPDRYAITPVFGAGFSVQHLNNFGNIPSYVLTGSTDANSIGFVAGAGLQFRAGPAHITPELRYTYWGSGSLAQNIVNSILGNRNQVQFLVGVTF